MEFLGGLESGIKGRLEVLPKLEDAAAAGEIAVRPAPFCRNFPAYMFFAPDIAHSYFRACVV